jgi:ATP-binding cassette subfamily C protein LapB
VIEHFDGEDTLEISFVGDTAQTNRLSMTRCCPPSAT